MHIYTYRYIPTRNCIRTTARASLPTPFALMCAVAAAAAVCPVRRARAANYRSLPRNNKAKARKKFLSKVSRFICSAASAHQRPLRNAKLLSPYTYIVYTSIYIPHSVYIYVQCRRRLEALAVLYIHICKREKKKICIGMSPRILD